MKDRSPGAQLVENFVDEVLNSHQMASIDALFHPKYRDHDPIDIPGSPQHRVQNIEYMRALCKFLGSDLVDVAFTLEDCFGDRGKFAYQLFGEGTIQSSVIEREGGPDGSDSEPAVGLVEGSGPPRRTPTFVTVAAGSRGLLRDSGRLVTDRIHIEYQSIGIFHVTDGKLSERRGPIVLR